MGLAKGEGKKTTGRINMATATQVYPVATQARQEPTEFDHLLLRDGTAALVHVARPLDEEALLALFCRLSPGSRWHRFFSASFPPAKLIASHCDDSNPGSSLTLLVTRTDQGGSRVIAAGSYQAKDKATAEVALAVEDAFQGKGLGTLLLERLALLAVGHGFTRFWATTHADNRAMLEVFRNSGFLVRETPEGTETEVDLSLAPSETGLARLETRHRVATVASLRPFFHPKTVAVVGASRDRRSVGGLLLDALVGGGFQGRVFPVNPKASQLAGLPVYPSVRALPEPPDLAVVAVPRDVVPCVLDDCAARGVRALLVISAGFAEAGPTGRQLQQELVDRARGYGMRLIGPNCLGLVSTDPAIRLNASFAPGFPPPGPVAMSSESGALGLAILAAAARLGLGISSIVSVGNRADVSSNDLLEYWEGDGNTQVILLYLESCGNPRRFARIARRVCRRKPVVAVKAGRTRAGRRAAGSHTAALAASDVAIDALFHQTGVIRAETLEEMFDLAAALSNQALPAGRRLGIVTNAGGPAILCADAAEAAGLSVPTLSQAVRDRLAAFLPAAASLGNPVDLIASATAEQFRRAVATVLTSGEVDALVVIYVSVDPAMAQEIARAIGDGVAASRTPSVPPRPVLACLMPEKDTRSLSVSPGESIPCYAFPEAAARVLGRLACYAEWRRQPPGTAPALPDADPAAARALCRKALAQRGAGWLTTEETRAVLWAMRLPVVPGGVARTADEAAAVAHGLGFPVAVKLASHRLVHKTEIGGVRLNVPDEAGVRQAFAAIHDRLAADHNLDAMEGVLIQPMVRGGTEVMAGVTHDPLFGPLVAFGLGGIHVEILGDVCFRVTPLTERDAGEMVRAVRGYRLFQGYRGHPPADIPAIEDLLLRVGRLVEDVPEIGELDLNPVFVLPPGQGCRILDARLRVEPSQE
jgi:acetyl coenzyme A synthetase (ADP forming)-like protein